MIAEESTSWPGVSHPVHHDGLGFSHKWNMGWMHDTLGYFAHDPVHRRWHHRDLTFGLLYAHSERFVLPLSHDEVVHGKGSLLNKMPGDEWRRFASLRALYGWMWAYPGDPMLFMGGEIAQWGEWSETKGVDWAALDGERHRGVQELVRALNRVAAEWPALWQQDHVPWGFQWLDADDADHSMYSFLRWSADGREVVACVANMTPVPREGYRVGLPWAGRVAGAARHQRHLLRGDRPGWRPGRVGRGRRAPPGPAGVGLRDHPAAGGALAGLPPRVTDVPTRAGGGHRQPGARRGRRPGRRLVRRPGRGQRAHRWPRRCAMSLLVFTGASQFAAVGVLATGGHRAAAVAAAASSWPPATACTGWRWRRSCRAPLGRRLLAAHFVLDESTAMATAQPDRPSPGAGLLALRAVPSSSAGTSAPWSARCRAASSAIRPRSGSTPPSRPASSC